jgi:WD40 repeat protein
VLWTHDDAPTAFLAVTPDDKLLVTAEFTQPPDDAQPDGPPDRSWIRIWDLPTGRVLAGIGTDHRKPRLVTVSPDSSTAVVGFFSGGTDVIDLATRRVAHTLDTDASAVTFSPDGTRLLLVDFAGHGTVFSTRDWRPIDMFSTLDAGYSHILVEPAGRLMFLASGNGVDIWDPAELRRLTPPLSLAGDGTNDAIFLAGSPREPLLAMANQSELVLLDLRESTWRDSACRIADRQLTRDEWDRLLPGRQYQPACGR